MDWLFFLLSPQSRLVQADLNETRLIHLVHLVDTLLVCKFTIKRQWYLFVVNPERDLWRPHLLFRCDILSCLVASLGRHYDCHDDFDELLMWYDQALNLLKLLRSIKPYLKSFGHARQNNNGMTWTECTRSAFVYGMRSGGHRHSKGSRNPQMWPLRTTAVSFVPRVFKTTRTTSTLCFGSYTRLVDEIRITFLKLSIIVKYASDMFDYRVACRSRVGKGTWLWSQALGVNRVAGIDPGLLTANVVRSHHLFFFFLPSVNVNDDD